MFNSRIIFNILGFLLLIEGLFMMLSIPVALIYRESDSISFLLAGLITVLAGGASWYFNPEGRETGFQKRRIYHCYIRLDSIFSFWQSSLCDFRSNTLLYRCFFRNHVGIYHHRCFCAERYRIPSSHASFSGEA